MFRCPVRARRFGPIAAASAAAIAIGGVVAQHPAVSLSQIPRHDASWVRLPPLPRPGFDVDGAALATAAGALHVAIVDRSPARQRASRLWVYRLAAGRWEGPVGRRPLSVNRGAMVSVIGGRRLCVVAPRARAVDAWCAGSRDWTSLGQPFTTSYPEPVTGFSGAFADRGRLLAIRTHLQDARSSDGGTSIDGRPALRVLGRRGRAWDAIAGEVDPTVAGGTLRPFGLSYAGAPCLAYDALSSARTVKSEIRVACVRQNRWVQAVPALTADQMAGSDRAVMNVDGATVADGSLYLGVDRFEGRRVTWPVMVLRGGRWIATDLGGSKPGWNSQGSLTTIGGRPWAVRFDQRPGADGLQTRLVVRTLAADGRGRDVGEPLVNNRRFYGPLYWGLVQAGRTVYAMATVPQPSRSRNVVAVFALRTPGRPH